MIAPDLATFKRLARKGNLIAVMDSVPADLETPVSSFLKLAGKSANAFLLESAEQEAKTGRYSFICLKPEAVLSSGKISSKKVSTSKKHPHLINAIEADLRGYKLANPEMLPGFCGGYVGFLSYENVEHFEDVQLNSKKKEIDFPAAVFFLVREFLIFDHFRKTLSAVKIVKLDLAKSVESQYKQACQNVAASLKRLRLPLRLPKASKRIPKTVLKSNLSHADFCKKVGRIKEYIRAGDCIQVVLSQRFTLPPVQDDFQIYRALRSVNPSPYMFYFRCGKYRLIGSSPEMLVKKTGKEAELRPIAGTRPRGATQQADLAHEENLKKSIKETAEHLMLVDLGRNDLGRVCEFDSIKVKNFARVERYSHVMHLVSDVTGRLKPGKSAFDLLRNTFPAGTVSGAPKIRAMQIIDELEPEKRGPYAGCLGYFSFNQDMDMCITIRTLALNEKHIYLQAGAGIVKDSSPEKEYEETVNKAKGLLKALAMQKDY